MRETGILGTEPNTRLLTPKASLSPALPGAYHSPPSTPARGQSTELLETGWNHSHFLFLGAKGLVISPGFYLLPWPRLGPVLGTGDKKVNHTWALA